MGFFNKPNKQTDIQTNVTVISSGATITGDVECGCALHIDGVFHGKIKSKNSVTIGGQGNVDGEINALLLSIKGTFKGSADCDEIEILSGGDVKGKLVACHLSIDRNCSFEGETIKRASHNVTPTRGTLIQQKT